MTLTSTYPGQREWDYTITDDVASEYTLDQTSFQQVVYDNPSFQDTQFGANPNYRSFINTNTARPSTIPSGSAIARVTVNSEVTIAYQFTVTMTCVENNGLGPAQVQSSVPLSPGASLSDTLDFQFLGLNTVSHSWYCGTITIVADDSQYQSEADAWNNVNFYTTLQLGGPTNSHSLSALASALNYHMGDTRQIQVTTSDSGPVVDDLHIDISCSSGGGPASYSITIFRGATSGQVSVAPQTSDGENRSAMVCLCLK